LEKEKKKGRYQRIYSQLKNELLPKCEDPESRMATIVSLLHHKMSKFFWTGFYMLKAGRLLVRSYQGPVACMELKKDTGVCWAGINRNETIVVPDVEAFPGHIACSSLSKSEIVVPLRNRTGEVIGVLDVDSKELNTFDEVDQEYLEQILGLIFVAE
jgi:GAF domain-containing protein